MNPTINQDNQNYDELINQLLQKHIFNKQAQDGMNPEDNEDQNQGVQASSTGINMNPDQNPDINPDEDPDMDPNQVDKQTINNQNPMEMDPTEIAKRKINQP